LYCAMWTTLLTLYVLNKPLAFRASCTSYIPLHHWNHTNILLHNGLAVLLVAQPSSQKDLSAGKKMQCLKTAFLPAALF
jgi:hypothetical protein